MADGSERRGAERVVAVDNEQYRLWVASRWGVELEGGEGFRAVHRLLGSAVEISDREQMLIARVVAVLRDAAHVIGHARDAPGAVVADL